MGSPFSRICLPRVSILRKPISSLMVSPSIVMSTLYNLGVAGLQSTGFAFMKTEAVPSAVVVSSFFIFSSGMLSVTRRPASALFSFTVKPRRRPSRLSSCSE